MPKIGRPGHLIIMSVAATLMSAAFCETTAEESRAAPGSARTSPAGSSAPAQQPSWTWLALYSHRRESAEFVSIDPDRGTLYVEATSPNLELASIIRVTRGRLPVDTALRLRNAVRALSRIDPAALAALRPIEPIEETGLLADVASSDDGTQSRWLGLAVAGMPPDVSRALTEVTAAASKLGAHVPPSVVQASPVEAARAERVRGDPRKIYRFVPVQERSLDDSPRLLAALRHPGLVVETTEHEDRLVRDWLRSSNPKRTSDTMFLEIEGTAVRGVFQMHVRDTRAAP